jgi:micrococcal nuclease
MFMSGNGCTQDVAAEVSARPGQSVNSQSDASFQNDEARSVVLLGVPADTRVTVYDDPGADRGDDYTELYLKRAVDVLCVDSFERSFENDSVVAVFHRVNGLDGKVSQVEVAVGPSEVQLAQVPPADTPPPTATLTLVPTEVMTPTVTLPAGGAAQCIPTCTLRQVATVTRIVDGDTIDVAIEGVTYRVRYIGIDTPEVGQEFSAEATAKNTALVGNRTVTLVRDVSEVDRYDRLLRYVLNGDVFVNHELVRSGYAYASTYPPDVACSTTFAQAQGQATTAGIGLWVPPPTVAATRVPAPTQPLGNCHPSYPDFCIPPPPPDLDCPDIGRKNFTVLAPDPHRFDRDQDGIGCES